MSRRLRSACGLGVVLVATAMAALALPPTGSAAKMGESAPPEPVVRELTTFAEPGCTGGCGSGSTIGPDGALYVTDGPRGRVLRVERRTGKTTTYADGLPPSIPEVGIGGAIDVAFVGDAAYVLVTLVGPGFGQPDVVAGVYRIGRHGNPRVIADIGAWSAAHPPEGNIVISGGVQYALESFRGGMAVTDGHHNRVLHVSATGRVRQLHALGNVVPTGLEVVGRALYLAQAGPIPHRPEDGRVVRFTHRSAAKEVGAGARLAVDVGIGQGRLFALSQGSWDLPPTPENEGKPAAPDTGALLRLGTDGTFDTVVDGLDRPTSLELVGDTAYVVTLTGKILRIDGVAPARCRDRR